MSKKLVFQVSIPPKGQKCYGPKRFQYSNDLYGFSNQRAAEYAAANGADYFCLTDSDWLGEKYPPCYHALYCYELFKEYDYILYLDSDAVITRICPDIFTHCTQFGATIDRHPTSPSGIRHNIQKNASHGLPDDHVYFTSCVMMMDKAFYELTKDEWRGELEKWEFRKGSQHDQSIFNVLVGLHYGPYMVLDDDWGTWRKAGKFIRHYSGPTPTREWTEEAFLKWEDKVIEKALLS